MTKIFIKRNNKDFRSKLRGQMTKSEAILWKFIKSDQLGVRFRRQYGISNCIVDFYCPKLKLVIEVDGSTHNEEVIFKKDIKRDAFLKSLGLTVLRYNSERIFKELNNVLIDIKLNCERLSQSSATPPAPSW